MTELEKQIYERIQPQIVAKARYYDAHKYCPMCGYDNYTTTLVDYVMDPDEMDKYADYNTAWCNKCGYQHKVHDRVAS